KRNIRVNLMPNVDVDGTVTVENAERFFLDLIEKTSTSDVAEVKHGEWILHDDGSGTCTLCGKHQKHVWDMDNWQNFCGNCGAKMDGGKAE
ncbi:MAG: hypothetical protein IKM21_00320, partial [Oscillospiraceae bacterium]|nr:hypothetical protein [Oscillospiraceae bacterium]